MGEAWGTQRVRAGSLWLRRPSRWAPGAGAGREGEGACLPLPQRRCPEDLQPFGEHEAARVRRDSRGQVRHRKKMQRLSPEAASERNHFLLLRTSEKLAPFP